MEHQGQQDVKIIKSLMTKLPKHLKVNQQAAQGVGNVDSKAMVSCSIFLYMRNVRLRAPTHQSHPKPSPSPHETCLPQVKRRTANQNYFYGSYVMQYGELKLSVENLFLYMGTNPANDN
ncbi:unnamed protein product [Fraxinus pennsylvanica]|uniref:Uncharacterized protein n=1 Tax=Fraxinus pennsylvanica TaxID=56036 RepID=A0AAD1ZQV0_9LAMI|nr:unnamed protein product [Fraxinus pennsylvanica]